TLQVWQLHAEYVAECEKDGQTYRSVLKVAGSVEDGVVLALTFPETAAAAAQQTSSPSRFGPFPVDQAPAASRGFAKKMGRVLGVIRGRSAADYGTNTGQK